MTAQHFKNMESGTKLTLSIVIIVWTGIFTQMSFAQDTSIDNSIAPTQAVEAWREDLLFLADQIEQLHPDPYHGTSRVDFERALGESYNRLADLTDDQVIVELMRLFGLLANSGKEGHSGVYPQSVFGMLPLLLYRFDDGWFVIEANDQHADLVGGRVTALGGTPVEDVVQAVSPLVAADNDTNLLRPRSCVLVTRIR